MENLTARGEVMRNALDLIKVGGACVEELAEQGLEVEMMTDFIQAERITQEMGKAGLTPKLSAGYNDFTEDSGFWLFLRDGDEFITSVAVRYDNIGRETMGDYMIRTMRRHYPNGQGETLLDFTHAMPPGFYGRMAYIGELFVKPTARGSRTRLLYFMLLLHCTIAAKWPVDWIYAMMRDKDVKRGFATNYGFSLQLPGVARWAEPAPEGRGDGEWLVALSSDNLAHTMHHYATALEHL